MIIPKLVLYHVLLMYDLTPTESLRLTCTAEYESSFNTTAMNTNTDGSIDLGLFQINVKYWGHTENCQVDKLFDPLYNIKCGVHIYKVRGIQSWYGYRYNKNTCDNYIIQGVNDGTR